MAETQPTTGLSNTERLIRFTCGAILATLGIMGLTYGASIVVPIVEAFILWFVLNSLARALQRMPRFGPRLGRGGAIALSVVMVSVLAILALYSGIRGVISAGPQALSLQESFDPLIIRLAKILGTDEADVLNRAFDIFGIENMMQQLVLGMVNFLNQFGVVAIFAAFLFADQALYPAKMQALFPDPEQRARAETLLAELGHGISSYLWVMTRVSALTALCSYLVMKAFGLDFAMFWAVMVFFLNFIPTIGSILGTLLPVAAALVQFESLGAVFFMLLFLGAIQFTIGNILFPRMAGNSLNLSFFVTIMCLFFWGALWGVIGMFLAVPLTAMIAIVLSQFKPTRPLAVLLSKNGQLGLNNGKAAAAAQEI